MNHEEMRKEISFALERCEAQELQMESDLKKLRSTMQLLRAMQELIDTQGKPSVEASH